MKSFIVLTMFAGVAGAVYLFFKPDSYYTSPLAPTTELAATFGEVRQDHFHLGLDIRTSGKENLPVYALADGYIRRASIQADGYGKALYIAHTNGITSVYAHLNAFIPEVDSVLTRQQYLQESWQQDMFFTVNQLPVKKGMVIAFSGNSGYSQGPHLHIELRNTQTKTLINPVTAGMQIRDEAAPKINAVLLYGGSKSFYEVKGKEIPLTKEGSRDETVSGINVVNDSLLRIGIEAEDHQDNPKFSLGIYHAQLFMDNKLQFEFKMDSIPFLKDRYVNATIDYARWIRKNQCIQLLTSLPGNRLPSYQHNHSNGILHLTNGQEHEIKIVVRDASGNSSSVCFPVKYRLSSRKTKSNHHGKFLLPGRADKLNTPNAVVYFSPHAFYDRVPARMEESQIEYEGVLSPVIKLIDPLVPIHTRYTIHLKTTLPRNNVRRDRVLMELISGTKKEYYKGEWSGDYMIGKFDRFGKIKLIVDTEPPVVHTVNWKSAHFTQSSTLQIQCVDNYGPVENFRAEIDGQWAPFEHKGNAFQYRIGKHLSKGKHRLSVIVEDKAGNTKCETFDFVVG